jgi:phage terminase large subunit-like protein
MSRVPFHVKPYCWLPGNLQERSEQDRAPYGAWQKLGFITPIGPTTDPRTIANKIAEINGTNKIRALAFDRWRINDLVSSMPSAATFHWDRMARATKT